MEMDKLIGKGMYTLYGVMLIATIAVDVNRGALSDVLFDVFVLVCGMAFAEENEPP